MYSLKAYYPLKTNDLIRVGRKRDGGYVINKRTIELTKKLVGIGISIDWSFEKDFKQKNKDIKVIGFDFSVSLNDFYKMSIHAFKKIFNLQLFKKKSIKAKAKVFLYPLLYLKTAFRFARFFNKNANNFFIKKGIDDVSHDVFISVKEMFKNYILDEADKANSVFLKIDIEASEYKVLPEVFKYNEYINGMVVEFHELRKRWSQFEAVMKQLMQKYTVTHVHANNFVGYIKGTRTPDCVEITFLKKDLISSEEWNIKNTETYPINGLDYACFDEREDLQIPFD